MHLDHLEAEAIFILREAIGEGRAPVMLFSAGKDSAVLLHLARKAFAPLIPPFAAERSMVRDMLPEGDFYEVHIDAPLQLCEARDVKGLYAKARRGEIKNFTGIDSPYEPPQNPDVYINTDQTPVDQAVALILEYLAH